MSITSAEEVAAEDAVQRQFAATAYAEVLHVAQRLQPDADVLDVRRAGQVWARLRSLQIRHWSNLRRQMSHGWRKLNEQLVAMR